MQPQFIGPSYNLESRISSVQRTVNMIPVPIEPGNERTQWVLKDVPGLSLFPLAPEPQTPTGLSYSAYVEYDWNFSDQAYTPIPNSVSVPDAFLLQVGMIPSSYFDNPSTGSGLVISIFATDADETWPVDATFNVGASMQMTSATSFVKWQMQIPGNQGWFVFFVSSSGPDGNWQQNGNVIWHVGPNSNDGRRYQLTWTSDPGGFGSGNISAQFTRLSDVGSFA